MERTIFSRGLTSQMEGWNQIRIGSSNWHAMMRRCSIKHAEVEPVARVMFTPDPYRTASTPIFQLTEEQTREYNSRVDALGVITGAPRHLALYLTLLSHNLLDNFINSYTGALNVTQPA